MQSRSQLRQLPRNTLHADRSDLIVLVACCGMLQHQLVHWQLRSDAGIVQIQNLGCEK